MTACPACGTQGHHVAIVMPWKAAEQFAPGKRLFVQHRCPKEACPQEDWFEVAQDEAALLKRMTNALATSPLVDLAQPAVPPPPGQVAEVLVRGGFVDPDLLRHPTAWRSFAKLGVTEENRAEVAREACLLLNDQERAPPAVT